MTEGKFKEKINAWINKSVVSSYPMDSAIYTDPEKMIAGFFKDYADFKKEVPDAPGSWYLSDSISVETNTPEILCLVNTQENYMGGAHGAYYVSYNNFDMRNGNLMKTKDIFKTGFEGVLNKAIEAEFRKEMKLKPNQSLTDGGLFDNIITYNDNFVVTKEGIEFLYNQYEIAPYAVGVIVVKVPFNSIKDVINTDVVKM